jgi:hypothetical protein
VWAN